MRRWSASSAPYKASGQTHALNRKHELFIFLDTAHCCIYWTQGNIWNKFYYDIILINIFIISILTILLINIIFLQILKGFSDSPVNFEVDNGKNLMDKFFAWSLAEKEKLNLNPNQQKTIEAFLNLRWKLTLRIN